MISNDLIAKMYELDEEQAMLRETIADFANDQIVPNRESLDREGVYPRAIHEGLLELGVLGMAVPENCGGLGMGSIELALVYEQLSRGCAGVATAIGANLLGSDPILFFGTEEQKQKYLTQIGEGTIGAYALTEPNAGTDAGGIQTIAERSEDGESWKLKGQKTYITNGGIASIYTIFALTDPTRGSRGMTCFIAQVDPENLPPGIEFPDKFDKMGINASETREIIFDGFEVRTEDALGGKLGRGFLQAMGVFDVSRPMIGTMGVGLGQSAFDEALKYAHDRLQFGKAIINFSGLRQMFVDMWLTLEGARAMVYGAARKVDRKYHAGERVDVTAWAAMAKFIGSEASRVSYDAMQATGGYGYMNETPFPKFIRDQKVLEIFEGTNQIQREQAGRQMMQTFQKSGSAMPPEAEDCLSASIGFGGEHVALAWRLVDATMEQVLQKREGEISLNERQEVHWIIGEMVALAESARFLSAGCARSGVSQDHYLQAMGQAYSREAALKVAARAETILRGGNPEAVDGVAGLLQEARTCADGLFAFRDRMGDVLLDPSSAL